MLKAHEVSVIFALSRGPTDPTSLAFGGPWACANGRSHFSVVSSGSARLLVCDVTRANNMSNN